MAGPGLRMALAGGLGLAALAALGALVAFAALGAPAAAQGPTASAYILYRHAFGEWSVVCWRSMAGPERSCYIDAPAIAFDEDRRRSTIRITPDGPSGLSITVSSRSGTVLGTPVVLRVDDNVPHERGPDALDHATWRGEEAAWIIEEFRLGHSLSLGFPSAPAAARETEIPLKGFDAALTAFRDRLAASGGGAAGP